MGEPAVRALSGWGRTAPSVARVLAPRSVDELAAAVVAAGPRGVLARGLGRSYGDAAQNAGGAVLNLGAFDAIGHIDGTGSVTCGAGVSIDTLLRHAVPQGWFVPVTPGTRQVSLGGAVAADVHGKNHHRDGSFGAHVQAVTVVDGRGGLARVTPQDAAYAGVLGGMGLCGVITDVTLRLLPVGSAWVAVDTVRTRDLDETMVVLADLDRHRYSVAWVDCLARAGARGRGVVTAGDHLAAAEAPERGNPLAFAPRTPARVPPWVPVSLVGTRAVTAFNAAYYRAAPARALAVPTHAAAFFHPLDVIGGWNRVYGPGGFVQYQFVSPDPGTVSAVLDVLQRAHVPGLLAVLKRFGAANGAPLSFPMPGWTLAVDAPARAPGLGVALDAADELVQAAGGRVYLAKDGRMSPRTVAGMYPDLDRWRELRAVADPRGVFDSDLARRLAL